MYWNNLKQSAVLHSLYSLSAPTTKQYTNLTIIFKRSAPFNIVCLIKAKFHAKTVVAVLFVGVIFFFFFFFFFVCCLHILRVYLA